MSEFLKLSCPSCGSKLLMTETTNQFVCDSCGSDYLFKQSGESISLIPITTNPPSISGNNNVVVRINNLMPSATPLTSQANIHSKVSENISGECPICGRLNQRESTFQCQKCQRVFICLTHQDKRSYICSDCEASNLLNLKRKKIDSAALRFGVFSVLFSVSMSGGSDFGLDFVGIPIVVAMISLVLGVIAVENKGKKGWWGIALSLISGVILWGNFLLYWNDIW